MEKILSECSFPQMFYTDLACKYGLDVAVFVTGLQQTIFRYAEQKRCNRKSLPEVEIQVVEGLTYMPFALHELQCLFPWWSQNQIVSIKNHAVKAKLVKQDCFNKHPFDRRAWYAVNL